MFKKVLLASAVALAVASPAHALQLVENWQMVTPDGTFANIDRINISGASATVTQQTDSLGNAFLGATFSELGLSYSYSYFGSNGDQGWTHALDFTFSGLSGYVNSLSSPTPQSPFGSIGYVFNPTGSVTVTQRNGTATKADDAILFAGQVVGIQGTLNNNTALQSTGTSQLLALILPSTVYDPDMFLDGVGGSLAWFLNQPGLFIDAVTNNTVAAKGAVQQCNLDNNTQTTEYCTNLTVTSSGDAYLYRVPEPASLALVGLGLIGAGVVRRRKVAAQ